jgi:hypothetical protein
MGDTDRVPISLDEHLAAIAMLRAGAEFDHQAREEARCSQVIRGARLQRGARRRRVPSQRTCGRLGRTILAVRAMSPASAARNPTHHGR